MKNLFKHPEYAKLGGAAIGISFLSSIAATNNFLGVDIWFGAISLFTGLLGSFATVFSLTD